ncbi:MAG TPA: polysaccharide deacetylase family protein [Solirubrobacteraceae bacterium]|nr:polysaccharide deacetylase family protein [Solirubrobacteraceae bacterium]
MSGSLERSVSFTFDDGPEEIWTERVIAELNRCRVRATFFAVGERTRRLDGPVRAAIEAGHDVQLHCHRHVRHTRLSERELELDTERALDALDRVGARPTLWRAPWGVLTEASDRVARKFALRLVGWSIDTHDWRGDAPGTMLAAARPELAGGGAVLMHDGLGPGALRSGCANTLALLAPLAAAARELGAAIEPLRSPSPQPVPA